MAVRKILGREFTLEVETATPGTYQAIGGIKDISFSPSTQRAETTDYDSAGIEEHLVASRGLSFTVNCHFLEDAGDGSRDAGQQLVIDSAEAVGASSLVNFKLTTVGGTEKVFAGSIELTESPEGMDDPSTFSFVVTRSGPTT